MGIELILVGLLVALGAVTWDLSYILSAEQAGHPHDEETVLAHNAAATVVVVIGVLLTALGARMLLLEKPASRNASLLFLASSLMFADGVLHFYVVSEHLAVLPFALFFVVAGAIQLGLGFGLFKERPLVYYLSVVVTLGLIALFFAARAVAVPFSEGPEEFEALGILSKVLEFLTLGVLGLLLYRWRATSRAEPAEP